jgi:opacity protein-like surface antigen
MFNKVFLAIIFTVTLSQAVDDFSSERLLGIEVGYATTSTTASGVLSSSHDVEVGFRIGAQNEEWRTTLRANFMEANGRDYQRVMLDFDRFVWESLYKTDSVVFKPFLGAHLGWLRYTDDIALSDNGFAYGGQMGLALNVLNQVDFDLSYRYTVTDMETVDNIGSVVFGVNYIY